MRTIRLLFVFPMGLEAVPNAPFESMVFVDVPEAKQSKNRIHIDVTAPNVDPILAHGATLLRPTDDNIDWHVLADPEGNEFCVFVQPS